MGPTLIVVIHFLIILEYSPYLISCITKNPWKRDGASCKLASYLASSLTALLCVVFSTKPLYTDITSTFKLECKDKFLGQRELSFEQYCLYLGIKWNSLLRNVFLNYIYKTYLH